MNQQSSTLKDALRSVVAIAVTPFDDAGRIDEDEYRALVRLMVDGGISVVTAGGNTGEYYSLSAQERRRVVELSVEAAPEAIVVAGVGLDGATAAADARAALAAGADCVMVHQPVHPFQSVAGWIDYHVELGRAVPEAPQVLYLKDDRVDVAAVRALVAACPSVVGVKYAVTDPVRFAELVAGTADLDLVWLCGLAERWAPFFAPGGAQGFTSGLATLDPQRSLRLDAALRAGDYPAALREWGAVARFEELRTRNRSEDNVSVVKEGLARLGLCRREVRPPISVLPDEVADEVADIVASWEVAVPAGAGR